MLGTNVEMQLYESAFQTNVFTMCANSLLPSTFVKAQLPVCLPMCSCIAPSVDNFAGVECSETAAYGGGDSDGRREGRQGRRRLRQHLLRSPSVGVFQAHVCSASERPEYGPQLRQGMAHRTHRNDSHVCCRCFGSGSFTSFPPEPPTNQRWYVSASFSTCSSTTALLHRNATCPWICR